MNLKHVINKKITSCLYSLNEDTKSYTNNLLDMKIKFKLVYNNSHFFLLQFFEKFFTFVPSFVYFNNQYVFYFIPSKKNRLINAKFSAKKAAFFKKFTKKITFVIYDEPIKMSQLVRNLFQHIPIHFLEYKVERLDSKLISVYVFTNESHLKFGLGQKGSYIKTINDLMHSCLDQRITLYLRSIGNY